MGRPCGVWSRLCVSFHVQAAHWEAALQYSKADKDRNIIKNMLLNITAADEMENTEY